MPRKKSAVKRARQSLERHDRLLPYKTHMKTMVRKVREAAIAGKAEDVKTLLPLVYKSIDLAAKKNIIHKNTAARKKSSVAKIASPKK